MTVRTSPKTIAQDSFSLSFQSLPIFFLKSDDLPFVIYSKCFSSLKHFGLLNIHFILIGTIQSNDVDDVLRLKGCVRVSFKFHNILSNFKQSNFPKLFYEYKTFLAGDGS